MSKAIVVLSGGMDSCVTLSIALKENIDVAVLHLNYGQRTEARELKAFNDIADFYGIKKRLVADITYLKEIGGSSLTDESMDVEEGDVHKTYIPNTYVPFRNTHIIAIAASWAEVLDFDRIYIGAVFEDGSGYPDTRPEYYEAYNQLIKTGTREGKIRIHTPLIHMSKKEIVQKGMELGSPLKYSWSCYKAEEKSCGVCDSCLLRLRGFEEAGFTDPIPYAEK
jgi:7-cyano-7-deazaguanine synthase